MRKKLLLTASVALTVLGALSASAQTSAPVAVRAGAHGDFDRLVFDWPRAVTFKLQRDGAHAAITFDGTADIKFTSDVVRELTRARGFTARNDNAGHVTVTFTVNPGAVIKSFNSSSSVVIDITGKPAPENVMATPPAASTAEAAPTASPPPELASPPVAATPIATNKPEALVPSPLPTAKPTMPAPVATAPAGASASTPTAAPAKNAPIVPPLPIIAPPAPPTPTAPPPTIKKTAGAAPTLALSDVPAMVASLDPHIATRAAIYQRAEVGYIIFDRKFTIDAATLANGTPLQIALQPVDLPKNSGFSFAVPPNADLKATLDGTMWKIFLARKQPILPVSTALIAQPDFALGARFLMPLPDAPEPIRMTDPVVGDNLILFPLAQSEAFTIERRLADFNILPAAQGLVLKPLTDKVVVRAVSDGIEITAEGGLQLSRAIDTGASQQSTAKARSAEAGKSIFDFAIWDGKNNESFIKARQRLQQTIVDVPEAERNRARLELARFYFANGNGEEALSLLNMLAKQVPDLRAHADFISLLGAAEILSYRADDGLRDLGSPLLTGQPEVELWQAAGSAEQRDWAAAEEKFAITESILTGYPEPFFSRFFVLAIEAAVAAGKDHEAADWLDYVSTAPHRPSIDPALSYLRGVLDAKAGRAVAAEEAWKTTDQSNDRLYKVRAELALIDLGVSTNSLTPAQAADRLEALRFGWRGDDLEVDILHRLGQFYISSKNVKAGLNAFSQAVALYPASPLTPKIKTEMEATFHDVFLGSLGKKLSPLDSLTLFQQYRDLMPTGKDGDEIMRNLSERLVAIDLLDQAASLLEDLTRNHLQGEEKDRAALRLAGIHLLNHSPNEALSALDITGADSLPAQLINERSLLHARALSELHRDTEATALLKDNSSQGAKMLRVDIAAHQQNWTDAAKSLMELVGQPPTSGKVLSPEQANWLLNAAISYALADDQPDLDRLAIDYSSAMASMPQNDTFRMLTQPEKTGQLRDLAAAQSQISQVDMFQGFLNGYRASSSDATSAGAAPAKKP